ncbi:PKD2, partial [Symbiodinium pilosum]
GHEDGRDLGKVRNNGPWTQAAVKRLFLVAPQCPEDVVWPAIADRVVALTKQVRDEFSLDPSRIYITGLSMGGFGAFAAAAAAPDLFAALIAVCGGFTKPLPLDTSLNSLLQLAKVAPKKEDVSNISELPVWLFHGMKDRTVDPDGSMLLWQALGGKVRSKAKLRITTYEALGHQIWSSAYKTSDLFSWLLRQKKPKPNLAGDESAPGAQVTPAKAKRKAPSSRAGLRAALRRRLAPEAEPSAADRLQVVSAIADDEIDEWDSDKDADVHPDDDAASGSWAFNDTE